MIGLLVESHPPVELMAVSTQHPPGIAPDSLVTSMQMFTRVWRTKVPPILTHNILSQYFDKLLQVSIYNQELRGIYVLYKNRNPYCTMQ